MTDQDSATIIADGDGLEDGYFNDISGVITVECGENITAGNVVYIHLTSGTAYVSDNATQNDRRASGIALTTATTGNDVIIQTRGRYQTTGLTDKEDYYLGNSGALSTTRSAVRIGTALSTTKLWINIDDERGTQVGQIIEFVPDATGVLGITAYWQLMDGTTISDSESPMNGVTIRDINANNEFLRSADTADMTGTGGTLTHTHGLTRVSRNIDVTGSAQTWFSPTVTDSNSSGSALPPYMDVVRAIKIK